MKQQQQFAMNIILWLLASMMVCNGLPLNATVSGRPAVVNIGAIFSFKTIIGKAAKIAVETAIEDVNSNPDILPGTKLELQMKDSNYSGFMAVVEGTSFSFIVIMKTNRYMLKNFSFSMDSSLIELQLYCSWRETL